MKAKRARARLRAREKMRVLIQSPEKLRHAAELSEFEFDKIYSLLRRNGKTFATLDALGIPFERKNGDE